MRQTAVKLLTLISLIGIVCPSLCKAADAGWKNVGIRAGISAKQKHEFFHQYEVFTAYGLPWDWRAASGWGVALQINAAAGALHGGRETGFIGTLGPGIVLDKAGKGLALDLGPNVCLMSQRAYGQQDFNGRFLFMAHVGLTYRFDSGPGVGYRFQHMSNGGIYGGGNPGLDLHMIGLSWNF